MLIQPDHLPIPGIPAVISGLAEGSLKVLLKPQLSVHREHLAGGVLPSSHPTYPMCSFTNTPHSVPQLCQDGAPMAPQLHCPHGQNVPLALNQPQPGESLLFQGIEAVSSCWEASSGLE